MHLVTSTKRELHKNLSSYVFKGTCRRLFSPEQHTEVAVTLKKGCKEGNYFNTAFGIEKLAN